MVRYNLYIKNNQDRELRKIEKRLGDSRSEHIRRAIDDYLEKLSKIEPIAMTSPSVKTQVEVAPSKE